MFVSTDLTEKVVEQMAASVDEKSIGCRMEFTTSPAPFQS